MTAPPAAGIRPNLGQFLWLALSTVLVGMTVGLERTVVPLLGADVYHLASASLVLSFIVAFGVTKAALNLVAGHWSDCVGRRPILIMGWLAALPMIGLLLFVHSWTAVVIANIFLGANQAFAWTMTITSQLDLVGTRQRGLAMGINEGTGYLGVGISTALSAFLAARFGLLQVPFVYGAVIIGAGLATSLLVIRETQSLVVRDLAAERPGAGRGQEAPVTARASQIFWLTTVTDRTLSALSQAGLANKLADTLVWGVAPLYLAGLGVPITQIGLVGGIYTLIWGMGQFGTGIISDYVGRKLPIVGGLGLLGGGILMFAVGHTFAWWMATAAVMGLGMALLYPNLNAAVADVAPAQIRGGVLGVYRLWRDGGYAIGGLLLGVTIRTLGMVGSINLIGGMVLLSMTIVIWRMAETHPPTSRHPARAQSAADA